MTQYTFPIIKHLNDVYDAIDINCFYLVKKDNYQIINYMFSSPEAFPPITALVPYTRETEEEVFKEYDNSIIKREFRGLKFDLEGNLICRPYHKFFNMGERAETSLENIDVSKPHIILEKLDGSMIAPFIVDGKIIWGTKMGQTEVSEQVEAWLSPSVNDISLKRVEKYSDFVRACFHGGSQPIFEWCSNTQRIVLDYPESKLVLTAIRNLYNGCYLHYEDMDKLSKAWGIPVVQLTKVFETENNLSQEFIDFTKNAPGTIEGFVIRFEDGMMYKIKSDHYCALHRVKSDINHERGVVALLLEGKIDDLKPLMPVNDLARVNAYELAFNGRMISLAVDIKYMIKKIMDENMTRKEYALNIMPTREKWISNIIFKVWDSKDFMDSEEVYDLLKKYILTHCSRNNKFAEMREHTSIFKHVPEWKPVMFSEEGDE